MNRFPWQKFRTPVVSCFAVLMVVVCGGCLLDRPNAPAPRYLKVILPEVAKPIDATMSVRLAPLVESDPFFQEVLYFDHGELRNDQAWNWLTPPHIVLERALRLHAPAHGVQLLERPGQGTVTVALTHFALEERAAADAGSVTVLQGAALVHFVGPEGKVHTHLVTAEQAVALPLPSDAATVAGEVLTALSAAVWDYVGAAECG